ncbi:hypothetical protein U1Q18_005382, partial [Sarracenia purpurea var. burkii]
SANVIMDDSSSEELPSLEDDLLWDGVGVGNVISSVKNADVTDKLEMSSKRVPEHEENELVTIPQVE